MCNKNFIRPTYGAVADEWIFVLKASTVVVAIADLAHWDTERSLAISTAVKLCQIITRPYRTSNSYITKFDTGVLQFSKK